jgi:hypothetical protein
MKNFKKFVCLCLAVLIMFPVVPVKANEINIDSALMLEDVKIIDVIGEGENLIEPRLDRIETHWINANGLWFFRRWNATRGFWIDPHWILYTGQL